MEEKGDKSSHMDSCNEISLKTDEINHRKNDDNSGSKVQMETNVDENNSKCPPNIDYNEVEKVQQLPRKAGVPEDNESVLLKSEFKAAWKTLTLSEACEKICCQQKVINQHIENVKVLEDKCAKLDVLHKELEQRLENANKQKDSALKEKENMVIRYAVGEKNLIMERQQKEQTEKKFKELQRDNELLQHKLQMMISEKARICQMFDNKCYEYKTLQQELDKNKQDLNNIETKLKWNQNSLKSEIEAHKECQVTVDSLNAILQDSTNQIEIARRNAEETIKSFMTSQENRAYILDQQVKEQQASLILFRHEKADSKQQLKSVQGELEKLQSKQKDMIEENNTLSLKVQHLERERLESEQKLSELRGCQDQQRQDWANLQTKHVQLEQLKLQLKHEQDQLSASNEQMTLLKQRNQELESDMESCRVREAELLSFTQQLTDKNVRLQSEFTAMETKVQQLACEQTLFKRQLKEQETKMAASTAKMTEEKARLSAENESLNENLKEARERVEEALRELGDQKGENVVIKRKFDLSLRELNKELQHCRARLELHESSDSSTNTSNSGSSLNVNDGHCRSAPEAAEQVKVIQPEATIDKQALIEHIVKLQRISAKKSEKIDFLEEHVNSLVTELQKKTKLLQGYVLREQSGTLTSNTMDSNKAQLAKLNGVMASVYSSRVCDQNLTLELSLDINRKLQAVVEDALLKNITLKENVDTLGSEIDRLNKILANSPSLF